jgi:hypothetical protein
MKMKNMLLLLSALLMAPAVEARTAKDSPPPPITAVRVEEAIQVDGQLNERVWQAPGYSAFTQVDPVDGGEPSEKTLVWVAYDDQALYVAAYLYDSEKAKIMSRIGRRDDYGESDWFLFCVDPFLDRRTGYQFAVNPAGTICDWTLQNDTWSDSTWDGVWQGKAALNGEGWAVEMRIPFSQLRFRRQTEAVWGVDFQRVIKRKNERVAYSWRPKEQVGFVSGFSRLQGLRGLTPSRYLELMPYTFGQARFRPGEPGNPFQTGTKWLGDAGLDLKWGLKSDLTLDATFNPDFGQVEVDPAVINLSAYETYYDERRPFFIEGADIFNGFGQGGSMGGPIFNWPSPVFFYSRRIGRAPQGSYGGDGFSSAPEGTAILGAAKLSGKIGAWKVGVLSGVTAREYARIDEGGLRSGQEIEPFTWYGAARAQREFADGRHGLGFIATGVQRDLRDGALAGILSRSAQALGVDGWTFLDGKRNWFLCGWLGATRVAGDPAQILRLQKSSTHFFQRPDAGYLRLDPQADSLSGWGGMLRFGREQGRFWMHVNLGAISPGFDPNDIGFQYSTSDTINSSADFAYRWPHPGKVFRSVFAWIGAYRTWDFGLSRTGNGVAGSLQTEWLNYWFSAINFSVTPSYFSDTLTRGGPQALIPFSYSLSGQIDSDSRRTIVVSPYFSFNHRPGVSRSFSPGLSLRLKPQKGLSLSISPSLSLSTTELQYLRRVTDPLMVDTFGSRYIFGRIDQKTLACELSVDWALSPRLSLQAFLQPFLSVGAFGRFKELARPRSDRYNVFGEGAATVSGGADGYLLDPDGAGPAAPFTLDNPDFNMKSLRGTVVLRWEYQPGSLLYFVWTQNRADYEHPGDLRLGRDLGALLTAPGDDIVMLKFTYRFNI